MQLVALNYPVLSYFLWFSFAISDKSSKLHYSRFYNLLRKVQNSASDKNLQHMHARNTVSIHEWVVKLKWISLLKKSIGDTKERAVNLLY